MNRLKTLSRALAATCFVMSVALTEAEEVRVQPAPEKTAVCKERQDVLQTLVRELLPPDYGLGIRHERDPYRWQSAGKFTGVTFSLKGDGVFDKREGKNRPHVYITFMPRNYDGKPMGISDDQGKTQVMAFPAKFLGLRRDLRVYACRDFGYGLPERGALSEGNLRKVLGIQEQTERSSQQPAAADPAGRGAAEP